MGDGDFRPPQLRDPSTAFMKLEIYNYFPDTTPHANVIGLRRRGWFGQIASLMHESFCPFSFLHHGHRSHLSTHPHALYIIYTSLPPRKCLFGVDAPNIPFDSLRC